MTPNSATVTWTAAPGTPPIFYITNHRVLGDIDWIPNPLGTTTALTQTITGLTGGTTYELRIQASNVAGVSYSNVVQFTTPTGAIVLIDWPSPIEWRGATVVAASRDVPIEYFAATPPGIIASRDFRISPEWTGARGIFRDMVVQIEPGATPLAVPLQVQNVQITNPTNTTLTVTWDDNSTGPRPSGYQVQWKRSIDTVFTNFVPTVAEPNPVGVLVSRSFAMPLEFGGHVTFSRNIDIPAEWRGAIGVSRNIDVPIAFGGNFVIGRNFVAPMEYRGTTQNVTRDAVSPLEFARTFRRNISPWIEWRLTAPTPTPTPTPTPSGPSPNGTQITPGVGSIRDNLGNVYTIIVSSAAPPGEAYENGAPMPDGLNTSAMEWFGGQVYAQSSDGNWYTWDGSVFNGPVTAPPSGSPTPTPTPTPTPAPTPTPTPTPTGTYIELDLGDPTTLIFANGDTWSLDQSDPGGGAAVHNGVRDGASAFCDILVYRTDTQVIWIRDQVNPGNWYQFIPAGSLGNAGDFWDGPFGDPRF